MKIECPSCRLSGNVNEVELPPEGRYVNYPRCKADFHIAKPAPVSNSGSPVPQSETTGTPGDDRMLLGRRGPRRDN